ncbi:hypothetical protein Ancab_007290 [Ancistrocladus abbreviatus]
MPATAGRVRMPANNRVHSSAALQTHGIWQSAIGYDPYAPNKDDSKGYSDRNSDPEAENAYASFQGLLALAKITGSNADEARGACKKCGRVGHLTFQCRNFLSVKDDRDKDSDAIQTNVLSGLDKLKASVGKVNVRTAAESSKESSEDNSESSDSSVDSEIERVIAEREGKKAGNKVRSSRKKDSPDDGEREKRSRSKERINVKRSGSDLEEDDDDSRRKRRKVKCRKRDESPDEEEHHCRRKGRNERRRRRRIHWRSDHSEQSVGLHKRKSRRAASPSDSDVSGSGDSRVGRESRRSKKSSRKHHHKHT